MSKSSRCSPKIGKRTTLFLHVGQLHWIQFIFLEPNADLAMLSLHKCSLRIPALNFTISQYMQVQVMKLKVVFPFPIALDCQCSWQCWDIQGGTGQCRYAGYHNRGDPAVRGGLSLGGDSCNSPPPWLSRELGRDCTKCRACETLGWAVQWNVCYISVQQDHWRDSRSP